MPEGVNVGVDAMGVHADSGGAVVLVDLLEALLEAPWLPNITVFCSARLTWELQFPRNQRVRFVPQPSSSRTSMLWWMTRGLQLACDTYGVTALLSMNALGLTRQPTVVVFQQQLLFEPAAVALMPLAFRARLHVFRALARSACGRAALVVAQAPHVAVSLTRHLGVAPEKIRIFVPDVRWPGISARAELAVPRHSFVYVGSDRPYKCVGTLVDAFAQLPGDTANLLLTLPTASAPSAPRVTHLGRLARADVRDLLSRATALVMPSIAETIGLPLVEAMDVGCPIAAADLPYARELCGDAACYFEPRNAQSCSAAMRSILDNEQLRMRLADAGRKRAAQLRGAHPYRSLVAAVHDVLAG